MSKINVQAPVTVYNITTGSFNASGSISASAFCQGYSTLRGLFRSDVITETASGLLIEQSMDGGVNWDYVSASDVVAASTVTACEVAILGNAVRVQIKNGATEASAMRAFFSLYPIT